MHLLIVISAILIIKLFNSVQSCIGVGGCGFAGCCMMGQPCARARGTKLLQVGDDVQRLDDQLIMRDDGVMSEKTSSSKVSDEDVDFLRCCETSGLPESCLNKCSYANYNRDVLRDMFFRLDACPIAAANDIHRCAGHGTDHRQCCRMNGVTNTLAQHKCLIFCDQRPQNVTMLDISYLPCFERFESIKGCFWRHATKQYDLKHNDLKLIPLKSLKSRLQQVPPYPFAMKA